MAGMIGGSADLRIVLLGKTGVGKSSTGNTILGEKLFETSGEADSRIAKCVAKTKTVDGRSITVIDTPGYFASDEGLKPEIAKCIIECSPGPHAFLIVLTAGRQTPEEKNTVKEILKTFGEEVLEYAVVLFTRGNEVEDDKTIQQFVDKNSHLKTLVQKCGDRLLVIDNKYWNIVGCGDETRNSEEIQKLLNIIDQMVEQNGGKHYTNEMLQAVAQAIEEERVNIRKETGGQLPEIAVNERAKEKVMKRFLIQAAGVAVGALMGALIGPIECVVKVCTSPALVAGAKDIAKEFPATGIALGVAAGAVAGVILGVILGVAIIGGAISGGITGAKAAHKAENAREAADGAFHAVTDPKKNLVKKKIEDIMQKGHKK